MPVVDRNILRLGAYELIWVDETPDAVVLDEAVQLAKEFSTDESPSFVNGLLGRFKDLKPSLRRDDRRSQACEARDRRTAPGGPTDRRPAGPRRPAGRSDVPGDCGTREVPADAAGVAGTIGPGHPAARFC